MKVSFYHQAGWLIYETEKPEKMLIKVGETVELPQGPQEVLEVIAKPLSDAVHVRVTDGID